MERENSNRMLSTRLFPDMRFEFSRSAKMVLLGDAKSLGQAGHQSTIEYLQTEMPEILPIGNSFLSWEISGISSEIFDRTLMFGLRSLTLSAAWKEPVHGT